MLVKNVNLAKVKKALRHQRVSAGQQADNLRFDALPARPDWPSAYLVLQCDPASGKHHVLAAGFGDWHCHFDDYVNPDRNVAAALAFLAQVVAGKWAVIAAYDKLGRYSGGTLQDAARPNPAHLPLAFQAGKGMSLRKYVFDRAPAAVTPPLPALPLAS